MICAEAKLKLEPCVSGTLSPEDRIALEEHLAVCEGCRLELELTRAVMGAPSFEGPDEPLAPAAQSPETTESIESTPEAQSSMPMHGEARASTPLFDEISFADVGSEPSAAGSGTPPAAGGKASGSSEADPFANFTPKAEAPAEQPAATWDFEPADVPRDSAPPEGSLSFANEALKRKRDADEKRKTTLVRLALWGGGIGCGLVLLGVSVWIALAFRQDKALDVTPDGGTPSVAPQPDATATPSAPDGSTTTTPSATAQPTPAPSATTQPTTTSAPTQPTTGSGAPPSPAPTILDATPGVASSPGPPPDATKSGSRTAKGKPKAGTSAAAKSPKDANSGDGEGFPWRPVDDVPTAPSRVVRTTGTRQAPDAAAPKPVAPEAAPQPEAALEPRPAPVNPSETSWPERGTAPSGGAPAPSAGATTPANPPPQPAGEAAQPQQDRASMRPIDRLQLATGFAAKNADLAALRKLKSSWKSLVGSTAGPDRTRAKLEYADCLWSIQELSGRNSDRRDALTAYRDYVLNAPAGGTNSRTVGRMRYLEDVLIDK
ncbi:MAG: hypothetical protein E6K79_02340 [Candidatus Eisenbacteria bacterium]|uniref:Putative zinc-finger domain-containing protein n=1 Tax=Eiseniibacteriota bacterium TaxID=2212470 RepID=A0A538TT31_UNCEI|nr:MAG: hypothetical protein E6K79_02340 [Candidatus Eisenbacteria bacterium]